MRGDPYNEIMKSLGVQDDENTEDLGVENFPILEKGFEVLDAAHHFIGRFCVFPSEHSHVAVTLWAALTHNIEHFHIAPRLALISAEAQSGKTRVLEILNLIVSEPMSVICSTSAAIFRTLRNRQITLLFDEVDAVWKQGDDSREELRALLNAGYKRGAEIPRCVGKNFEVEMFPVFCAVALAGIGEMPETILTRSIVVKMQRRAPDEHVDSFRSRMHEPPGHAIRLRLATWMATAGEFAGGAWPEMPTDIVDRPAEIWEPLLAVADAAGGQWPVIAREACVALCGAENDTRTSLGVRLLGDLRTIFQDHQQMATKVILEQLVNGNQIMGDSSLDRRLDDDAPWGDLHGREIDSRKLARLLRPYAVKAVKIKVGTVALQGYRVDSLSGAWKRYLRTATLESVELPEPVEPSGRNIVPMRAVADKEVPDNSNGSGSSTSSTPAEGDGKGEDHPDQEIF